MGNSHTNQSERGRRGHKGGSGCMSVRARSISIDKHCLFNLASATVQVVSLTVSLTCYVTYTLPSPLLTLFAVILPSLLLLAPPFFCQSHDSSTTLFYGGSERLRYFFGVYSNSILFCLIPRSSD